MNYENKLYLLLIISLSIMPLISYLGISLIIDDQYSILLAIIPSVITWLFVFSKNEQITLETKSEQK